MKYSEPTYKSRHMRQLKDWVDGESHHNETDDECCPDFSCCGYKQAAHDVRLRYMQAVTDNDEATKSNMLCMFLSELTATTDASAIIAGQDDGSVH